MKKMLAYFQRNAHRQSVIDEVNMLLNQWRNCNDREALLEAKKILDQEIAVP